jgi:hypothetical protein
MPLSDKQLHDRWLRGHELHFAWRVIPDEDLQQQYDRSGDSFYRRESVISLMKQELANGLLAGKFVAIGAKIAPEPSGALEAIPAHFFHDRDAIHWDEGAVQAHSHIFRSVRVIGLPKSPRQAELEMSQSVEEVGSGWGVKAIGRPQVVPLLCSLIRKMKDEGVPAAVLQKERIALVRTRAKAEYPDTFPSPNGPARTTVIAALKQEGY